MDIHDNHDDDVIIIDELKCYELLLEEEEFESEISRWKCISTNKRYEKTDTDKYKIDR